MRRGGPAVLQQFRHGRNGIYRGTRGLSVQRMGLAQRTYRPSLQDGLGCECWSARGSLRQQVNWDYAIEAVPL